jgi:hypothetical protein
MTQTFDFDLTADDIRVLAALIYEPVPRVWIRGRWSCPFCLALNAKARARCFCGLPRETDLSQESIAAHAQDDFMQLANDAAWIPHVGFSDHCQSSPSTR